MEEQGELFKRRKTHNEIFDDSVIKYTINIPIKTYEKITEICREKKIHRSVWFREAINKAFNMNYTATQMIDYEIWRRLKGGVPAEIVESLNGKPPERLPKSECARVEKPIHGWHKFPGFIGAFRRNSFNYNLFRRETFGGKF